MTPQQLVGIAVRLFATWLALSSIGYFVAIPAAMNAVQVPGEGSLFVSYFAGAVYLAAAIALWFFPMVVAHTLVPKTRHDNVLSFQAHELAKVGCALLGIWAFAKALPSLVWFLVRSYLVTNGGSSFSALTPDAKAELLVALVELVVAALLVAKAGAFAALVTRDAQGPAEAGVSASDQ